MKSTLNKRYVQKELPAGYSKTSKVPYYERSTALAVLKLAGEIYKDPTTVKAWRKPLSCTLLTLHAKYLQGRQYLLSVMDAEIPEHLRATIRDMRAKEIRQHNGFHGLIFYTKGCLATETLSREQVDNFHLDSPLAIANENAWHDLVEEFINGEEPRLEVGDVDNNQFAQQYLNVVTSGTNVFWDIKGRILTLVRR